jgi:hypothetical protein
VPVHHVIEGCGIAREPQAEAARIQRRESQDGCRINA